MILKNRKNQSPSYQSDESKFRQWLAKLEGGNEEPGGSAKV
jgi:hypothetical protein